MQQTADSLLAQFILNRQSGLPLYLQIAHEVMYLVETGVLREGDRPPSLRKLSKYLGISFLTVDKAYRWLQSRGVLKSHRGVGWEVGLGINNPNGEGHERLRIAKLVDEMLISAIDQGFDPMTVAQTAVRRAASVEQRLPIRKLVFVECQSEYIDDYIGELQRGLTDLNVQIRGMLVDELTGASESARRAILEEADYVVTTLYHFGAVKKALAPLDRRVLALNHTIDNDSLYKIVSLPANMRLGALFGPADAPPAIIRTLEYYRDQPPGSIPYAAITDAAATRKMRAGVDVVAYTQSCRHAIGHFFTDKGKCILLRFVPDEDAIKKLRTLLLRGSILSPRREVKQFDLGKRTTPLRMGS